MVRLFTPQEIRAQSLANLHRWKSQGVSVSAYAEWQDLIERDGGSVAKRGWQGRLVNLPPGDTEGVTGLCLDPHDLAIAKYVARREKDLIFTRELARREIVTRAKLLALLKETPVEEKTRARIRNCIGQDFAF